MGEPAKNLESLLIQNDYIPLEVKSLHLKDLYKQIGVDYTIKDKQIDANGIITISDIHGNYDILRETLQEARETGSMVVINGDLINDYHLMSSTSKELGIENTQDKMFDYYQKNLSQRDLEALITLQQVQEFTFEGLLETIPPKQRIQAKKEIEKILKYSQNEMFQKRIEKVGNDFHIKYADIIRDSQLQNVALYELFFEENAKQVAEICNEFSDVTIGIGKGNHEPVYFSYDITKHLNNKNQLIDLNMQRGKVIVKDNQGQEISFGAVANTVSSTRCLSSIFPGDYSSLLYHHMSPTVENSFVEGELTKDKIENANYQDEYYKRIHDSNVDNLDILFSHGQIGKAMYSETQEAYQMPYLASAGKLSLEAKLTVEGHIHSSYFGDDKIRPVGNQGARIYKDEQGNIKYDRIQFKSEFLADKEPVNINIDDMKKKIDERVSLYKLIQEYFEE